MLAFVNCYHLAFAILELHHPHEYYEAKFHGRIPHCQPWPTEDRKLPSFSNNAGAHLIASLLTSSVEVISSGHLREHSQAVGS